MEVKTEKGKTDYIYAVGWLLVVLAALSVIGLVADIITKTGIEKPLWMKIISPINTILQFFAGFGLIKHKNWARILLIFLVSAVILFSLGVIIFGPKHLGYRTLLIVSGFISCYVIYYFTRPQVKKQFH